MRSSNDFHLTNAEIDSALWKKLDKYLNERIVSARKRNDADMSYDATNSLRGEIRQLKKILALGDRH